MKIIFTGSERYIPNSADIFTVKEEVEDVPNDMCRLWLIARHGLVTKRQRTFFYPRVVRTKIYLYKVQEIYADRAMYKE